MYKQEVEERIYAAQVRFKEENHESIENGFSKFSYPLLSDVADPGKTGFLLKKKDHLLIVPIDVPKKDPGKLMIKDEQMKMENW